MTDKEKDAFPSYATTWWYLKCREYKQAWKESYEDASKDDRDLVKKLPNFCPDLFFEISWIRVDEEVKKKIIIDWKEIEISEESFEQLKKQLNQ